MNYKVRAVIGMIMMVLCVGTCLVSAAWFTSEETAEPVNIDSWTPIDKCWVYQPDTWEVFAYSSGFHGGEIKYFVTYINQNGQHKIEKVDIDTWYNIEMTSSMQPYMYH